MPITTKFSQTFYDHLGHVVADEMVEWFNQVDSEYQKELRAINDLNFERFDAKQAQRFAEYDAKLDKRFAESDIMTEKRFTAFEIKFERRFAQYDVKLETRFAEAKTEAKHQQMTLLRWMIGMWVVQLAATAGFWMQR